METSKSYPIKIYYVNALLYAKNELTITLLDGTKDTNIDASVYPGFDNFTASCDLISITYYFSTSTSFKTIKSVGSISILKNLKSKTTYGTTKITSYIDDDHPVIEKIILVATLYPVTTLNTATTLMTTANKLTTTTSLTTFTETDGYMTVSQIIIVECAISYVTISSPAPNSINTLTTTTYTTVVIFSGVVVLIRTPF